ncbi:hypothetical protein [Pandoraea apista]|uniref:hypothetical protein n=1 Tax=Pandoraea apista TaxID=93218 RepID=UPI000659BD98|nr:hypothetical protein [Pandoraea apista]ALS64913.1 hypothetical protein AT395_07885 [Pandoraea apista]CFB65282.1 hypothetical protein LMG16407_04782 [Pandoraea apista]
MDTGVVVICVVLLAALGFLYVWKQNREANLMTRLTLPLWRQRYAEMSGHKKLATARSFIEQSLHVAHQLGGISPAVHAELRQALRKENPVPVVDEWLLGPFYNVVEVVGSEDAARSEARLIGALIVVAMSGADPTISVRRFMAQQGAM